MATGGAYYDPETIDLLRTALEEAWGCLTPERQQSVLKTELAERILAAAALGERDPAKLRTHALMRPLDTSSVAHIDPAMVILRGALTRSG
jgi:hypothetical protein